MSKHISDFKQHLDELVKLRDEYDAEVVPSYALPNGVDIGEIYSYANSFKQAITLAEELHAEVERLNKQNNSFLKAASRNLKKYNQLRAAADKMKEALVNAAYHIDQLQHVKNKDFSREEVVLMIANVFQAGEDATKALSTYEQARGGE
jgi:uncharacterized coiled-coil DUF342 family protein